MDMVNVIIDGKAVEVEKGSTVLQAAQKAGINIPQPEKKEITNFIR